MDFSLDKLIGHPAKKRKTRKRKRDSGEANAGKEGAMVIDGVLAPLESTMEEVPRLLTIKPEASILTKEVEVTPPALMDVKVVETTLALAPFMLSTVMEEEEVQVAELLVLALPMEPAIIDVAKKEGPVMAYLSVIEATVETLLVTAELLTGEVAGEIAREAVGEVAGEVAGEATVDAHEVAGTPMAASPEVGCLVGIFSVVTVDSSSRLYGSPPRSSQVPNLLLRRLIDCFTQCLQVGPCLSMLQVSPVDPADHFSFLTSNGD